MELIAAIGGGAFVLASLVLGGRLMLLSLRTRGLPEFTLGFGLFLMGGLGYPMMAVAQQSTEMNIGLRVAMLVTQMLFTTIGMSMVTFFTRRVFRPADPWAAWATPACAAAYLSCFYAQGRGAGFEALLTDPDGVWVTSAYVGIVVMAWTGWESLRYHLLLRRRMGLGLADPVVVDRFRLWTISMFSAASISLAGTILQKVFGISVNGTTAGHLLVGPMGLVCATALWLAFLPPAGYLRRVSAPGQAAPAEA
jgi:hypothetical protein